MLTSNSPPAALQSNNQINGRKIFLIAGIILIAANLRAAITSVGPLIGIIREDVSISSSLVGFLTTLPLIAFAIISPLAPKLARRIGIEAALLTSLVILAVGILIRSLTSSIIFIFAGTGAIGVAIGIGNVLLPSLIKRDFPTKIGLVTGIYSVSMGIWASLASGLSIPIVLGLNFSWQQSLLCWSTLAIVGILIWLPQLRIRHQYKVVQISNLTPVSSNIWRSGLAWQVTLFMGLQSLGFYVTIAWLPEILYDRGMSITAAGWMLSLMQFSSLPANFIVPVLAARRSSQRGLIALSTSIGLVGYIGLLLGGSSLLITLWIICIGISQGALISLALTLFGLRTANAVQAAALSGMAQSIGYLLAAAGPILFGFLYEITSSWTAPMLLVIGSTTLVLLVGLGAGRNALVSVGSR